jgi:small GTP-binding protein
LGDSFKAPYTETRGCKLYSVNVDGTTVKLWDTAGLDKYSESKYNYLPQNLDGLILMFDLTSLFSFKTIYKEWLPSVKEKYGEIPIVIVGNKADCRDRKVEPGNYIETSSKTSANIDAPIRRFISN